ncbi:hypothetical protein Bca4012_011043 [Brassica carinata]
MKNLFVQIFERERRIVEEIKQQIDLFDQHLASKCLLAGVSPPSWLWSPSLPSQTSELNKEEIIPGLMFPPSRPSFICPSGRFFSYQQPVSVLADSVIRCDLTFYPLEEQLLEEDQQHDLSHNLVRCVSNHSHEQDADIASLRDVHEEERLPETVSTRCGENQRSSPEDSQNQRVGKSLDATSPGRSQGKVVSKSVSVTGLKRKASSPRCCQNEVEPNTCLRSGLPLEKIQRSKSRQKAMELRSSAKASKGRSKSRNEPRPSPGGNIGLEIASLRSDSVSGINLYKHDENDEEDQCMKFSSTSESSTPHQKMISVPKSFIGDASVSLVPESLLESGHVNEMNNVQTIETNDEVSAKVDEQVDDPQCRSFNETLYLDGDTRSKSSSQDSSKREHHKSSNSFSGVIPSDAATRIFQSETNARSSSGARGNRSKTEHSGSVESSSVDMEQRLTISLLQGGNIKESLIPSAIDVEGLLVENITSDDQSKEKGEGVKKSLIFSTIDVECSNALGSFESSSVDVERRNSISLLQCGYVKESLIPFAIDVEKIEIESNTSGVQSKEKGECVIESLIPPTTDVEVLAVDDITRDDQSKGNSECVDTNRCSSAGRVSQTGISTDKTTFSCAIQDSTPKTELLGFVESSSVDRQSRPSVMQSDDENVLLKLVTVTSGGVLVEEDNAGESVETSSTSNQSQADIMIVEPVVVKSIVQESGTLEELIDHSSCAGSNQCHGRLSRPRRSPIEEESANENSVLSVGSDRRSADEQLEVRAGNSSLRTICFDDSGESSFDANPMNTSAVRVSDVPSLTHFKVNLLVDNETNDTEDQNGLKKEMVLKTETPSHTGLRVGENEPPESNTFTGQIDALRKSYIQEFFSSSSSMERSQLKNKRRRTLNKLTIREPSSSPRGDILDSDTVRETVHHNEEAACDNLNHYDVELPKIFGSAPSDYYEVELQKMIGSASR